MLQYTASSIERSSHSDEFGAADGLRQGMKSHSTETEEEIRTLKKDPSYLDTCSSSHRTRLSAGDFSSVGLRENEARDETLFQEALHQVAFAGDADSVLIDDIA